MVHYGIHKRPTKDAMTAVIEKKILLDAHGLRINFY
jgi:hypothetical protein